MGKCVRVLSVLLLVTILMLLVSSGSAYVTIRMVDVSVPFPVTAGELVEVRATVFTKRFSCCGSPTVSDVQAVLILPDGVTLVSGNNPSFIGTMDEESFAVASWTVVFQKNVTYILQVQASGYDSAGLPCNVSKSTKIAVGLSSSSFDIRYVILTTTDMIILGALCGVLIFVRRKRTSRTSGLEQSSV